MRATRIRAGSSPALTACRTPGSGPISSRRRRSIRSGAWRISSPRSATFPSQSSCGSINGDKHFFDAIADALSPALLNGHNAGFIRSTAHLAVIVVNGDAEDDGAGLPENGPYLTSLAKVLTDVQRAKPDPRMASVSYINSGAGTLENGQRIGQLVAETRGVRDRHHGSGGCLAGVIARSLPRHGRERVSSQCGDRVDLSDRGRGGWGCDERLDFRSVHERDPLHRRQSARGGSDRDGELRRGLPLS